MRHVPPVTIRRSECGNPFAALAEHIHDADVRRARGLSSTAAARRANRGRRS